MRYETGTILIGTALLFAFGFILIALATYLYFLMADKQKENKLGKKLLLSAVLTLGWMISTVVAIWLMAEVSVLGFMLVAAVFMFVIVLFITPLFLKLDKKNLLLYSGLITVALNPGWLILLGIL